MHNQAPIKSGPWKALGLAGIVCLLSACGDKPVESAESGKSTRKSPAAGAASAGGAEGTVVAQLAPKSAFSVSNKWRDPFFPKRSRASESGGGTTNAPVNVIAHLEAGFQGTIGTGEDRLGLIHNAILEPGKTAVITFMADGRQQRLTVRCRAVLRNGVVLEVPGQQEPVTITGKNK